MYLGTVNGPFQAELPTLHPGGLDVSVEHISNCEHLARQFQLLYLLNDLEAKYREVFEFSASRLWGP